MAIRYHQHKKPCHVRMIGTTKRVVDHYLLVILHYVSPDTVNSSWIACFFLQGMRKLGQQRQKAGVKRALQYRFWQAVVVSTDRVESISYTDSDSLAVDRDKILIERDLWKP